MLKRIIAAFCTLTLISVTFYTIGKAENTVKLPILMYHHFSEKMEGLCNYVLSVNQFERDLQYLKKNGYNTISAGQLKNFCYDNGELPPKPCMITFDDGFESVAEYILPLLKKYKMVAILTVIGYETDRYTENGDCNPEYAYMNWNRVRELDKTDEIEVECHTYDMHKLWPRRGADMIYSESLGAYKKALTDDITIFQKKFYAVTSRKSDVIAIPFGSYKKETLDIYKSLDFKVIFTCTEKINTITRNAESITELGRYNRPSGVTSEQFFIKWQ